jgi:hypothetical protein
MEVEKMEKNGFLAYANSLVKTTRLEKLKDKYCNLVLLNGYTYQGILLIVYNDAVIFMDRKVGRRKFQRDNIFVCYETPIAANKGKYKSEEVNENE